LDTWNPWAREHSEATRRIACDFMVLVGLDFCSRRDLIASIHTRTQESRRNDLFVPQRICTGRSIEILSKEEKVLGFFSCGTVVSHELSHVAPPKESHFERLDVELYVDTVPGQAREKLGTPSDHRAYDTGTLPFLVSWGARVCSGLETGFGRSSFLTRLLSSLRGSWSFSTRSVERNRSDGG
jgi:hypothetical protein